MGRRPAMTTQHILVVDDDPTIRSLITDYLSTHDLRVSTASDGEGMARALAESIVDLIVLDLRLGKEDGLELLRELRGHSPVPIIVLTGQRLITSVKKLQVGLRWPSVMRLAVESALGGCR
jgi:two-component system, OmpR family, response regulator